MESYPEYLKGRGAQINPPNPYLKQELDVEELDGIDEAMMPAKETEVRLEHPKKIINKVDSPDVPFSFSINPYQGCEHGCVYCYARNAHQYWGLSAGLDFERIIIVKENAPKLLLKELSHPKWEAAPIMFSGNTDCYQPLERKFRLTRQCLEVLADLKHPASVLTKNGLILRDKDVLQELAKHDLVHAALTITTLNEDLRRKMEPRTAPGLKRIQVVEALAKAGIPTSVMLGPIIPGLNNHEFPELLQRTADAGARAAYYTYIRLNGSIGVIFEDWIRKNYPDRAEKVLGQIRQGHGGQVNDSTYGRRMRGAGPIADSISDAFKLFRNKYYKGREMPPYNLKAFQKPGQLSLF
ncbi:MAG: PA0069 family radical SAM protein [Bacteroidota bacterium]